MIADIDTDVRIVPRGSYVKTPTGQVYQNRSFAGKVESGVIDIVKLQGMLLNKFNKTEL